MFEFQVLSPTKLQGIYCLLLYYFILIAFSDNLLNTNVRPKSDLYRIFLIILVILYSVTDFVDMDFFHYYMYIVDYKKYGISSLEPVYDGISKIIIFDYLIFRCIVWGAALLILYKTFLLSKLNTAFSLYTFFVIFISLFAYARISLGFTILFYGYICLKSNKYNPIISLLIMCSSVFFHRTMIIPLLICLIPTFKPSLKFYTMGALAIPLVALIFNHFISNIDISIFSDPNLTNKIQYYINQENQLDTLSFFGKIYYVLGYLIFLVPLFLCLTKLKPNMALKNEKIIYGCFQIAFIIIVISIGLEFINLQTIVLAYRIRYMSMIPLCICFCMLVQDKLINKTKYLLVMSLGVLYISMKTISVIKQAIL